MARRGSKPKPRFVLMVLAYVLMSLVCQEIAAARGRLRSKEGCTSGGTACHARVSGTHKPPEMEDYGQSDESPSHDGYDYDFYRKHGDIPSPGAGH